MIIYYNLYMRDKSVPSRITHLEPWMPPAGCYDATRLNGDFTDDGAAMNETTANRSSRIVARKTPETAYRFDLHNDLLKAIKDGEMCPSQCHLNYTYTPRVRVRSNWYDVQII